MRLSANPKCRCSISKPGLFRVSPRQRAGLFRDRQYDQLYCPPIASLTTVFTTIFQVWPLTPIFNRFPVNPSAKAIFFIFLARDFGGSDISIVEPSQLVLPRPCFGPRRCFELKIDRLIRIALKLPVHGAQWLTGPRTSRLNPSSQDPNIVGAHYLPLAKRAVVSLNNEQVFVYSSAAVLCVARKVHYRYTSVVSHTSRPGLTLRCL